MKIICAERGWAGFASKSLSYSLNGDSLLVTAENQYVKPSVAVEYSISMSAISGSKDFDSHASFNVLPGDEQVASANSVPFNMYAQTVAGRTTSAVFASVYRANPMMSVLVPLIGSDASEWQLCFNVIDRNVIQLQSGDTLEVVDSIDTVRHSLPVVKFEQSAVNVPDGGHTDLTFKIVGPDGLAWGGSGEADVYLSATGGALSSTKIRTTNKTGSVRLFAVNTVAGEKITVKAGFKYYVNTGSVECSVQ